jgi:hypothetical protein
LLTFRDALHAAALRSRGRDNGAPGLRPEYSILLSAMAVFAAVSNTLCGRGWFGAHGAVVGRGDEQRSVGLGTGGGVLPFVYFGRGQ